MMGYGSSSIDNLMVCGRTIRANGLPVSGGMRLIGPSVTRSVAYETGGSSYYHCDEAALPMDRLEIVDASSNVLVAYDSPGNIWGGDIFDYTGSA